MNVTLIVPWRATSDRKPAWTWLKQRWQKTFPDWELIEADCPGVWNKSIAINRAVERSKGDIIVMADADCIVKTVAMEIAVKKAETVSWVVPHGRVFRLTKSVTKNLLKQDPASPLPEEPKSGPGKTIRSPVTGVAGGGLFVIRHDHFLQAGMMDEGYKGWGGEDSAFGFAADTLVGPHFRLNNVPLIHLWHNVGPRQNHPGWDSNLARTLRYKEAKGNKTKMKKLIKNRY